MPGAERPTRLARFESFELDVPAGELRGPDGASVRLPEQSLRILLLLLEHPGEVVQREEIRQKLWPNGTIVEFEHSISAAINRLRQALGDSADEPHYLETLARRGYRWKVPVEWVQRPREEGQRAKAEAETEKPFDRSLIGKKVSHYRVLEVLGGGGMGVVYKAEDLKLGRRVALKFLPEEMAGDPATLNRFEREARAASALSHPNICIIHAVEEHERNPFIVMEHLEGETLREVISRSSPGKPPLELQKLIDLAMQISEALDAAHRQGIIHRDIKPANIFVTTQGQAKILDFGLAKFAIVSGGKGSDSMADVCGEAERALRENAPTVTPDPFLSRTGVAMGTAGYMSPEQVRGEKLDARTDLFSFGLVLYEMATGKRAFAGATGPALQEATLKQVPRPAQEINPLVPARLEQIIGRALEKEREARYQAASEIRADLQGLKKEESSKASAPTRAIAAGVIIVGMMASAAYWNAKRQPRSHDEVPDLKLRQLTTNSAENRVLCGAISPDGKNLAYSDHKGLHLKVIETGEARTVPQPETPNDKDVDWDISANLWFPDSTRFLVNAYPAGQQSSDMSSQGTSIWIASVSGGPPRKLRDKAVAYAVSPDGSLVSFGENKGKYGDREIWLMGPDGTQARKLYDAGGEASLGAFAWAPDGQYLIYSRLDESGTTIVSRDLKGGPPTTLFPPPEMEKIIQDFTWLADGRLIYPVREPGAVQDTCNYWSTRLDARTGQMIEKPRRLTNWTGFCMGSTTTTSDGKRITFDGWATSGTAYIWDLEATGTRLTNSRHFTLEAGDNVITDWIADGKSVIVAQSRGDNYGIYKQLLNSDTAEPILASGTGGYSDNARMSPDGKWVIAQVHPIPGGRSTTRPLMRIPMTGGSAELIFSMSAGSGFFCTRPPENVCAVAEPAVDRKQMIVTAFDAVKGRGIELARYDIDPLSVEDSAPLCDISPDGTRLATSRGPEGPLQILSLRGQPPQFIRLKDIRKMRSLGWAADGKSLFIANGIKAGTAIMHVGLQGDATFLLKCSEFPTCYARPSPDGRHLAIYDNKVSGNMWMMENF